MKYSFLRFLVIAAVAMFMVGCATYPLGMSEGEWESLTPEQQHEARMLQAERDEAERQRRLERQRQRAEEERQLEELRHSAPYGEVVQCTVTNARGHMAGDWRAAQNVSFAIHRSESDRQVRLVQDDRPTRGVNMHITFDGLNVRICRWHNRDCDVLAGTEPQFREGVSTRIDVHRVVRGELSCAFPRRSEPRGRR